MADAAMDRIEREVLLRAPRSRVWRALTSPREFASWFGVEFEGTLEPGNRVRMRSTIQGYQDQVFDVVIERMEPERLFSWRWHPGAVRPDVDYSNEPTTLVTFSLEDAEGGTRVRVIESGFDRISLSRRAAVYQENVGGWEEQLSSLARHVGQA